jgi:transcriptional regulator with XRE-family HTH domain
MTKKIFPNYEKLKKERLDRDWIQEWVADAAGISARTLQRIEKGEGCTLETLKAISSVYEINFKDFLLPLPQSNQAPVTQQNTASGFTQSYVFDFFVASWSRLTRTVISSMIITPLLYAFLFSTSAVGIGYTAYSAHNADLINLDFFDPLTEAEQQVLYSRLEKIETKTPRSLQINESDQDPQHITAIPQISEEQQSFMNLLRVLAFFAVSGSIFGYLSGFQTLCKSRDWHFLVALPVIRAINRFLTRHPAVDKLISFASISR